MSVNYGAKLIVGFILDDMTSFYSPGEVKFVCDAGHLVPIRAKFCPECGRRGAAITDQVWNKGVTKEQFDSWHDAYKVGELGFWVAGDGESASGTQVFGVLIAKVDEGNESKLLTFYDVTSQQDAVRVEVSKLGLIFQSTPKLFLFLTAH